jgi:ankyrin repeat protein
LLHLAARRGSRPALDYLLDHGVEPAKGSPELPPGFPAPIHAATAAGRSVAVVRLLAAGAAAEALDEKGRTPLQVAVAKGDLEVLTALLEGGASPDHTGREEHRNPPLVLAAMLGQRAAAERLLAAGARGDGSNRNRVTALMFASYRGDGPLVKALLLAGVEVDARNRDGNTALLFAAVRSRGEILDLLLQRGADPDVRAFIDAFGEVTPLLLAAGRGEAENVRRLLEGGASVDAAGDVEGHGVVTPLLLAAARGFPEVVALLLAHGADPHRRDDGGHTALDRARQGGHAAVAELLEGAKATSGPAS